MDSAPPIKEDKHANKTNYHQHTAIVDPNENTIIYAYDDKDNLISITDAEGNSTVYTYDDNNNRTSETDANGNKTTYNYTDWVHTTGENTDDFFSVTANEWNSAVPITYGDITLTKAVKMESKTTITFEAPKSGKLTLVTHATAAAPAVKINNTTYSVSDNGSVDIDLTESGTYTFN